MASENSCVVILLSPKYCQATYLDSGRANPKDYTNLKKALDNALVGLSMKGCVFKRMRKGKGGVPAFHHLTQFACIKQPDNSVRDAYYAIHQIRALVQDEENLTLPDHFQGTAKRLAAIQDRDLRQEFYRIQELLARIIIHDVCTAGGLFHYEGPPLRNAEVEGRLKAQGDFRYFNTKEGFKPFPAEKIVSPSM